MSLRQAQDRIGIFIHIPKTGGMSISDALQVQKFRYRRDLLHAGEYQGLVTFGHELLPWLQRRNRAPKDAFCFAFCRNPYSRAVSLWAFNNKRNKMDLTFEEFCLNWGNWVWRIRYPQAKWLDKVNLDFLGRFENLEGDFDRLCDALGVERRPLPHLNATQHGPCRSYYTAETRAIVRAVYARDFDRFGYAVDHLPD